MTKFSMKNVGVIFMAILLIFGGGFYAVQTMKMEQFPNVDIPYLNVAVVYPGASPEQVLEDVAKPLEAQLAGVKDVKNLYVTAAANAAYATLEFDMTKVMDDAEKDVNAAVAKVKLPDTVKRPEVHRQGPTAEAVYTFAVDGGGADQATVQQYVEEKLKPQLVTVEGVSKIEVDGSSEKKLYVKVNPDKLKEHNLTLDKVKQALLANNVSAPTGTVTVDGKSMNVQVGKTLTSVDDVKNVNLILVEQDSSGLTNAFKQVGDGMNQMADGMQQGFGQVQQGMGQMGQGLASLAQGQANLTKGQVLMQKQVEIMGGINALSADMLANQAKLAELQKVPADKQTPELQQQAKDLQAKVQGTQAKITELQNALQTVQQQVQATGEEQTKLLQGMQAQMQGAGSAQGGQAGQTAQGQAGQGQAVQGQAAQGQAAQGQAAQGQAAQGQAAQGQAAQGGQRAAAGGGQGAANGGGAESAAIQVKVSSLKLSDIAEVTYGSGAIGSYTRLNGQPAVIAGVVPSVGANTVEIVETVINKLNDVQLPTGYNWTKLRDDSVEIKKSVNSMLREAVFGALLAAVVTLLFLRNLKSTIVALLSIPLSILATMIIMKQLDYSLNMMTLAGIAVAVGRVVDDSIVVIENIYRRIQITSKEERNANLVLLATREVGSAITSSTLTTIAVFVPLAFVPGIVGKFFQPFAWSVVIALAFSLLIAVTVVPLLSRMSLLNMKPVEHKETMLVRGYKKLLIWSLSHKLIVTVLCLALLGGTAVLVQQVPQNFFPAEKVISYTFTADLPIGSSLEKSNEVAVAAEKVIHSTGEVTTYNTTVRPGTVRVRLEVKDTTDTAKFEETVRAATQNMGEGVKTALKARGGIGGGDDLFMVINGPDLEAIKQAAELYKKAMAAVPGLADVRTNIEGYRPQVTVTVDDAKAAERGVNPVMIMGVVRDMISGSAATNVTIEGKTTELNLGLQVDAITSLDTIADMTVTNMAGQQVRIGDIANVEQKTGATSVQRLNQAEYISLTGKFTVVDAAGVQQAVDNAIKTVEVPAGVSYYFEGASKAMNEGFLNMAIAIGVSIVLVYMVMMVAFGEMLAPLAILFSLPFIFVGAVAGLYVTGESLGMPAMVGILMLIGIVVTNAIVLIDRVMQNRSTGMATFEALVEAGATRLRPILMTALATVGALVPLAISSEGGLISRSLAIVVISGLTTSTLLTLIIVPIAYTILDSIRNALFFRKRKDTAVKNEFGEIV